MSYSSEKVVFSPAEQLSPTERPIQDLSYIPPTDGASDPFPYKLVLSGDTYPLYRNGEAAPEIEIVSHPQSLAGGEVILGIHPYATVGEVIAVGNAFPRHPVYSDFQEREQGYFESTRERGVLPEIGGVALRGVYLYLPTDRIDDILRYPDTEESRLEAHGDSPDYARYVFARGTVDEPLLKVVYEPSTMPFDLPPLNYTELTRIVNEYFGSTAAISSGFSIDDILGKIREAQLGDIQTATENQLRLAHLIVGRARSWLAGITASDAEIKALQLGMLNRIFDGAYVDIEGAFRSND